jgi:GDPmannose 4,6-dehydratase
VGIDDWRDLVYIDPEFYRPAEVDYLLGDATKAKIKLGWRPKHNLHSLVKMMIDYEKF